MEQKEKAAKATSYTLAKVNKKNGWGKDKAKVFAFFINNPCSTSRQCMNALGILPNSLTWYIRDLIREGYLYEVRQGADPLTGRCAKFYSPSPCEPSREEA